MRVIMSFVLTVPIASVLLGKQNAGRVSCFPNEQTRKSNLIRFPDAKPNFYYVSFPKRGGLATQLRFIYEDLQAAKQLNRSIFLPMIEDHKVYKEHSNNYHPFRDYFNVSYMRSLGMQVMGPQHTATLCQGKVYLVGGSRNPRLERYYKQYYNLEFVGIWQNQSGDLRCIGQYLVGNLTDYYSDYGEYGQGYSLRGHASSNFKKIWATFDPSREIKIAARNVLNELPLKYNCVHLRRGDFELHCRRNTMQSFITQFGNNSCFQSESFIKERINDFANPDYPIYITTDCIPEAVRILAGKRRAGWHKKDTKTAFVYGRDETTRFIWYHYHNATQSDLTAMVDQIVCANAAQFIGNRFSGFTSTINNMRYECNTNNSLMFWE